MKKKDFSRAMRAKSVNRLRGESGQTSIFVALIFQVLFVLFAMALNIGMVVHDKINLQNSVDLAAYYAAQRQAEWLNVIAHTNYQIRQSMKLFAFRYRVLGTMGMDGKSGTPLHPSYASPKNYAESIWNPESFSRIPYVCISYIGDWDLHGSIGADDNLCRVYYNPIPALPPAVPIASFNPINTAIYALTQSIQATLNKNCEVAGIYSWYWASAAAQSFREDQRNRMELINAYAANLAETDPVDIRGDSISDGAEQTMRKNLTAENLAGGPSFEFFNSMQGIDRQTWLPRVYIVPFAFYMDVFPGSGTSCSGDIKRITEPPTNFSASLPILRDQLFAEDLLGWTSYINNFNDVPDVQRFSLGVEKNPWYMAYVGVRAEVRSKPIFFPFGNGVTLTAEAYAKPFGGRVGPWYYNSWPRAQAESIGDRVDQNVPYRVMAGTDGTALSPEEGQFRLPNYSKYPGDALGMASYLSQNAFDGLKTNTADPSDNYKIQWFLDIWRDITASQPTSYDRLSWDLTNDQPVPTRYYEIAAIAPDLFDIMYYSIEPDFQTNYMVGKLDTDKTRSALGISTDVPIRPDLGHRPGGVPQFSVQAQIDVAKGLGINGTGGTGTPLQNPAAFYYTREKSHLLTGWVSGPNFGMPGNNSVVPTDFFGQCEQPDDGGNLRVPGSCLKRGGISGYSVKLVNKEALIQSNDQWQLGGVGTTGSIKNPPTW